MFTIAQLSDPHLGPLPEVTWRELASKRVLGYVNWRRHRARALGTVNLRNLIDDLRSAAPDHVAVTGDLINLGLDAEIDAARDWLAELGPGEHVSVVPGNHDAYMPGAVRRFSEAWQPWMSGDDAEPRFPYVRRRGPVGIVGVSTAVATAPFMATGLFDRTQAEALARNLERLGEEGLFRVVLIHHPPIRRSTEWHRRLIGAREFRAAVEQSGAELILHGHNHRLSIASLPGSGRAVPVIGATSASKSPRPEKAGGSHLLFAIEEKHGRFACDMIERGAKEDRGAVTTLREVRLIGG